MFFPTAYFFERIQPLFGYHCTLKQCDFDGTKPDKNPYEQLGEGNYNKQKGPPTQLRALQDHLRNKHKLALCSLCIDARRDFIARLPRFTPSQLKAHLSKGDGTGSGFTGHPVCEFCRPKRFYDMAQLYTHLQREHYKCDLCERQERPNQYFRHYQSLEKHFDQQHFLCHDVQCLQARFMAFENEIDLRHHERQVHGGTSTGTNSIQLEFRVARPGGHTGNGDEDSQREGSRRIDYSIDGQVFSPETPPRATESKNTSHERQTLHPQHLARTAMLRAHASQIRREMGMKEQEDAFPALDASSEGKSTLSTPLQFGWNSGSTIQNVGRRSNAGVVTDEAFPTLPTSSNATRSTKQRAERIGLRSVKPRNATKQHDNISGYHTNLPDYLPP